jgi:hypothetical protein
MIIASPQMGLVPFTPRVTGYDYTSEPSGPIVYVSPGSTSIVQCPLMYPFDPRNLSLEDPTYF